MHTGIEVIKKKDAHTNTYMYKNNKRKKET